MILAYINLAALLGILFVWSWSIYYNGRKNGIFELAGAIGICIYALAEILEYASFVIDRPHLVQLWLHISFVMRSGVVWARVTGKEYAP